MGNEDSICHVPILLSPHFLYSLFKMSKRTHQRKSLAIMHIHTELYTVVNVSASNQIQVLVNYSNVLHSLGGVLFWCKPFNSAAEVVVSSLRRLRLRSNSTGTKHSSPREQGTPQCFGNQLETPDRQRLSPGRKVPKSASVSTLSLIITPGQTPNIVTIAALKKMVVLFISGECICRF